MPQEDLFLFSSRIRSSVFLAFPWECSFSSSLLCECLLKQCSLPYTPTLLKLTLLMTFQTRRLKKLTCRFMIWLKKKKKKSNACKVKDLVFLFNQNLVWGFWVFFGVRRGNVWCIFKDSPPLFFFPSFLLFSIGQGTNLPWVCCSDN